jgi:membrane protease YdiL (CAAX protease family)
MTPDPTATPSTSPPTPSLLRSIFFGPEGLRAGWGLILFLFFTVALGKLTTLILDTLAGPGGHSQQPDTNPLQAGQVILTRFAIFLDLALATWIMSRIERRPVAAYGSGGSHALRRFVAGCFSGLFCVSALAGCFWATGFLAFDGVSLHGAAVLQWASLWTIGFLMVALAEETSLRAYMQFTLTRGLAAIYGTWFNARRRRTLGFWTAAALLACLFISNHSGNPGESRAGLAQIGLFALLMCFSLWRTGSLWWAIGFHAAFDWGEAFLFGVADSGWTIQGHFMASHPTGNPLLSGGSAGVEASLFATGAWALGALLLCATSSSPWSRTDASRRQS